MSGQRRRSENEGRGEGGGNVKPSSYILEEGTRRRGDGQRYGQKMQRATTSIRCCAGV